MSAYNSLSGEIEFKKDLSKEKIAEICKLFEKDRGLEITPGMDGKYDVELVWGEGRYDTLDSITLELLDYVQSGLLFGSCDDWVMRYTFDGKDVEMKYECRDIFTAEDAKRAFDDELFTVEDIDRMIDERILGKLNDMWRQYSKATEKYGIDHPISKELFQQFMGAEELYKELRDVKSVDISEDEKVVHVYNEKTKPERLEASIQKAKVKSERSSNTAAVRLGKETVGMHDTEMGGR